MSSLRGHMLLPQNAEACAENLHGSLTYAAALGSRRQTGLCESDRAVAASATRSRATMRFATEPPSGAGDRPL